jgi:hypothetical protein
MHQSVSCSVPGGRAGDCDALPSYGMLLSRAISLKTMK